MKVVNGMKRWEIGDRVTWRVFMSDGTWKREGDSCLKHSPLRHGSVVARSVRRDDEVVVVFDDATGIDTMNTFLDHGLEAEEEHTQ